MINNSNTISSSSSGAAVLSLANTEKKILETEIDMRRENEKIKKGHGKKSRRELRTKEKKEERKTRLADINLGFAFQVRHAGTRGSHETSHVHESAVDSSLESAVNHRAQGTLDTRRGYVLSPAT